MYLSKEAVCLAWEEEMLIQSDVEDVDFLTSNNKEERMLTLVGAEVLLQTAA